MEVHSDLGAAHRHELVEEGKDPQAHQPTCTFSARSHARSTSSRAVAPAMCVLHLELESAGCLMDPRSASLTSTTRVMQICFYLCMLSKAVVKLITSAATMSPHCDGSSWTGHSLIVGFSRRATEALAGRDRADMGAGECGARPKRRHVGALDRVVSSLWCRPFAGCAHASSRPTTACLAGRIATSAHSKTGWQRHHPAAALDHVQDTAQAPQGSRWTDGDGTAWRLFEPGSDFRRQLGARSAPVRPGGVTVLNSIALVHPAQWASP